MAFLEKWKLVHWGVIILSITIIIVVFRVSIIQVESYYNLPLDRGDVEVSISDSSETIHFAVGKEARNLIYLTLWLENPDILYQVDIMLEVYDILLSYDINITARGIKIMIPYASADIIVYSSNAMTYEQYLAENITIPEYEDPKRDYLNYYQENSTELIYIGVGDDYIPSRTVFLDSILPVLILLVIISLLGFFGYKLNTEMIMKKSTSLSDTYPKKHHESDRSQLKPVEWERIPTLLWASSLMTMSGAILSLVFSNLPVRFFNPLLLFLLGLFGLLWLLMLMGYIGRYILNNAYYLQFLLALFFAFYYELIFSDQTVIDKLPLYEYWFASTLVLYLFSPILFFYSLYNNKLLYRDAWRRILLIVTIFLIPPLLFGSNELLLR